MTNERRQSQETVPQAELLSPVPFAVPEEYREYGLTKPEVMYVRGEAFLLYRVYTTLLFRHADRNEIPWTYFLYGSPHASEETFTEADFAACYESLQYGRCLFYDCPAIEGGPVMLCYRQDGAGYFEDWGDRLDFTCPPEWQDSNSLEAILTLPASALEALSYTVFTEQVWPAMSDPYLSVEKPLEGRPMEFICGSEAELRQVTRWCFHAFADLFGGQRVECTYYATMDGYQQEVSIRCDAISASPPEVLQILCALAYEYNSFVGTTWEYNDGSYHRRSGFDECPLDLSLQIEPPAHTEQAEAFLQLFDWLEGKTPDDERRLLLGLL